MGNLYVGLLHFPMRNRRGEIVATSTTSMDVHDIARSARTYDVNRYFVVTPLPSQQAIAWRIRGFWTEGERAWEASRRGEAMEYVVVAEDLEETIDWIEDAEGQSPLLVATSARGSNKKDVSFDELRDRLRNDPQPVYILFGTGWGMTDELIDVCDVILPPIMGNSEFNHLSVRAAVAIMLDRVAGDRNEC
ncbi:RNA methyltransferase [Candidatus Bipolaricaulota bacterium]|nr:RNA methyltransferase [Candidatus Bipolaricaulota bacterium]